MQWAAPTFPSSTPGTAVASYLRNRTLPAGRQHLGRQGRSGEQRVTVGGSCKHPAAGAVVSWPRGGAPPPAGWLRGAGEVR